MRHPLSARVHPELVRAITEAAAAAAPSETGGVVAGWWEGDDIVAQLAIEVVDPDASGSSWARHETAAQQALDDVVARLGDPWLGYVGDWHSHPADCGPSPQDRKSIARASRSYDKPLLLLVHRPDGSVDLRAAHRGHARPVTGIFPDDLAARV